MPGGLSAVLRRESAPFGTAGSKGNPEGGFSVPRGVMKPRNHCGIKRRPAAGAHANALPDGARPPLSRTSEMDPA